MISLKKLTKELWDKLIHLPSISITYEDGQQILWIMLRKEDFKKTVKEIYSKKRKGEISEAKTR